MRAGVRRLLAVATTGCLGANAAIVVADVLEADFVLTNSAEVGVPKALLPYLTMLKAAGAAGVLAGLAGSRSLGMAASTGLVLFYVGAVAAHVRSGALRTVGFPATYLGLAAASLAHFASGAVETCKTW